MMGKIVLSARMQAAADMVTRGNRICDVGCDHGFVSIYLVQNRIAPAALAMDLRKGPLMRAREHVEQAGLSEYIELRLSDGLCKYQTGEAQTLILAGMGGPLMQRILDRETDKTRDFSELILQPQSEIAEFRSFLRRAGYTIIAEDMVMEEAKFYPVIKAASVERTDDTGLPDELSDRFGPLLLQQKHAVLQIFLRRQSDKLCKLITALEKEKGDRAERRKKELARELEYLRQAAKICGMEG